MLLSLLQLRLLQDAVKRPWRQIVARVPGDRHPAGFRRVFVLAVAAFRNKQAPAILFYQF